MAGTVRTLSYLNNTIFPANAGVGSIGPQQMEDVIASAAAGVIVGSRTITTATTLLSTDNVVFVNQSAALTVTLYASPLPNQQVTIIDMAGAATTYNITIAGGGALIDGSANLVLSNNYAVATLEYNGTNWNIVGGWATTAGSAYNPASVAITGGTIALTGLLTEFAANAITAHAGGGQTSAYQLTAQLNNVTVVGTAGDSIKLPASVAGYEIEVINSTTTPMQVFGAGTDMINGVATATGVTQPGNSVVEYSCTSPGAWYAEGLGVGFSGSLFTESATDNIIAHAGGGQSSATQLTTQTNRVITVATAGDSVKLPASAPGLELIVINAGANTMQVYGLGTDTVDGVATATGVSQMKGSLTIYTCATAGAWFTNGLGTGYSGSLQTLSYSDGLTAHAGGTQAAALLLTSLINRISTVATAGDSVLLPVSAAGLSIVVINNGAQAMQVFGSGTDTINAVATATGVSQMIGSVVTYVCTLAGAWEATGIGTGYSGSYQTNSTKTGITALPGGGQPAAGSAYVLSAMINNVSTCATAGNSVLLPPNSPGMNITVINNGVAACSVYADSGATMNGTMNGSVSVAVASVLIFYCFASGAWVSK